MIRRGRQLAALMAASVALAGLACGSDEEDQGPGIPRSTSDQLSRQLDLVRERVDVTREQSVPGSCRDIDSKSYPDIQRILDGLPEDTDRDVRRALERSIDRLKELTQSECSRLIEEIEKRREETPPAPEQTVPEQTVPQETETEEEPKEKPKKDEKDKDEQDEKGPGGTGTPGQNGGTPVPPIDD